MYFGKKNAAITGATQSLRKSYRIALSKGKVPVELRSHFATITSFSFAFSRYSLTDTLFNALCYYVNFMYLWPRLFGTNSSSLVMLHCYICKKLCDHRVLFFVKTKKMQISYFVLAELCVSHL